MKTITGLPLRESDKPGGPATLDPAAEASSLLARGLSAEAEDVIRAALKVERDPYRTANLYCALGRIWSAQNRTHDAQEAFRHAVFLTPMYPVSHLELGQFLLKKGELREAEAEMRAAIRLKPQRSSYHTGLAAVLLEQCFFKDAHASLRRAMSLDRRNTGALEILAKLLAAKRDYRGAERALKKARAIDPNSVSTLWVLADILEQQGKTEEVVVCKNHILELNPNNAPLRIGISDQFRKLGRFEEAEHVIRQALASQPSAAAYHILSQIMEAQSRTTEAIAAMREACKLDPENNVHRASLAKLAATSAPPAAAGVPLHKSAQQTERTDLDALAAGVMERFRALWRRTNAN